ncbi:MAG: hypothetical protein HOW73_18950 [Polyangiaceae bacterium]|nr:hypothetical protein [Polyangiaceae bacterium]
MKDPKPPAERAKESVERGLGELFKAAKSVGTAVRRETQRSGGFGKALDDASREVVRAASNVATRLGTGIEKLGRKAQEALDAEDQREDEMKASSDKKSSEREEEWPKTREEYEKKYGRDGDDWPRSREEYIEKYGRPPRKRGDDDDPGYRIA